MLSQLKKTAAKFKAVKLFGWLRERENKKKSWRKLFPLAPLRINDLHEAQRVQKFYSTQFTCDKHKIIGESWRQENILMLDNL
jgi:hypothetical protein